MCTASLRGVSTPLGVVEATYVDGFEEALGAEYSKEFYERWQKRKLVMVCSIFLSNSLQEGDGDELDAFVSMLMVP